MEKEIEGLKICSVCCWLSNNITPDVPVCSRAAPIHIPHNQIFTYKKAMVRKHTNLNCEKFLHITSWK